MVFGDIVDVYSSGAVGYGAQYLVEGDVEVAPSVV
jgi:hypothetical protein